MSTGTVYTCPNEKCSDSTEHPQQVKCPTCGTKTAPQPDNELVK